MVDAELAHDTSVAANAQKLIPKIEQFRQDLRAFYTEMKVLEEQLFTQLADEQGGLTGFIGNNPTIYRWHDARGDHEVEVQLGPFRIPWLRKKKSGGFLMKKVCIILTDHSDNGGRTWVRITKTHPTDTPIGVWTWNAFPGQTTKVGRVAFDINGARIAGTTRPRLIRRGAAP